MTTLSRRAFGALALGAPAFAGFAPRAVLAAGHSTPHVAGTYRADLGRYRITALLDGVIPLGRELFSYDPATAIDAAMAEVGYQGDTLPAPVSAFLLQSADRTILIDAGVGGIPAFGEGFGNVAGGLAAAGVSPDSVDTLILTHAHPDHFGGMLQGDGAGFPNAELIVAEEEVGFWSDDAILAQAPAGSEGFFHLARGAFAAYAGRTTLVGEGAEIAPGISLHLSPGHTPGHSILRIDGGDRSLLMMADTIHSTDLHTALPEIGFGFDVDTGLAAQSRLRLFDQLASDGDLVTGSHIHFPGFGRIRRSGDAYRFVPTTL